MIELINVSKTYTPKKGNPVKAIKNISLSFLDSGFVFILGKSGSGKSTLLNLIGGLDKYDSGEIIVDHKSTKNFLEQDWDSYRNSYLGFIFQDYNVLPEFNVKDNVSLALKLQKEKQNENKLDAILKKVGILDKKISNVTELSGGQKQRVAIARALIKNPKVILADEPTGALDSKTGNEIFSLLKELSRDHLVICVSHDEEDARKYGDRIIKIKDGEIEEDISKEKYQNEMQKSGLSIVGNLVNVTNGYQLTNDDVRKIQTLINNSKSFSVKVNNNLNDGSELFKVTNTIEIESLLENDTSSFSASKSSFPLLSRLKMAFNNFSNKKIRLISTLIIGVIGSTLFGISQEFKTYDEFKVLKNTINDNNDGFLTFTKKYQNVKTEAFKEERSNQDTGFYLSDKTNIEKTLNKKAYEIYNENGHGIPYGIFGNSISGLIGYESVFYDNHFYGYSFWNDDFLSKNNNDFSYQLVEGSSIPVNDDDIVIPMYFYEYYKKSGVDLVKTNDDGTFYSKNVKPSNYQDIIGGYIKIEFNNELPSNAQGKISYYKIVGILDTNLDLDYKKKEYESKETGIENRIFNYLNISFNKTPLFSKKTKTTKKRSYVFGDKVINRNLTGDINKYTNLYLYSNQKSIKDNILWFNEEETIGSGECVVETFNLDNLINFASPFEYIKDSNWQVHDRISNNIDYCIEPMDKSEITLRDYIQYPLTDILMYLRKKISWNQVRNTEKYRDFWKKYVTTLSPKCLEEDDYESDFYIYNFLIKYCYYLLSGSVHYPLAFDGSFEKLNGFYRNDLFPGEPCGIEIYKTVITSVATDCGYDYKHTIRNSESTFSFSALNDKNNHIANKMPLKIVGMIIDYSKELNNIYVSESDYYKFISLDEKTAVKYDTLGDYCYLLIGLKETDDPSKIVTFVQNNYKVSEIDDGTVDSQREELAVLGYEDSSSSIKYDVAVTYASKLTSITLAINNAKTIITFSVIIFAILTCAIFINYISTSVDFKKKEIGILRALGARKIDVISIFIFESLYISLITFILGALLTYGITGIINLVVDNIIGLRISIIFFEPMLLIYMLLITLVIGLISTLISVGSLLNKKTIDIVRSE